MLPQQFQQSEPSKGFNNYKDFLLIIAGVLGALIAGIILGTTHVISFDWLILFVAFIMLGITIFFVRYSIKTRRMLQEKYQADLAALRKDFVGLQNNFTSAATHEFDRLNNMFINNTSKNEEEQDKRFEAMEKRLTEKITDAANGMDVSVKNALSIFSGAVQSYDNVVESYKQELLRALKRMDAPEERFREESLPES